jgi:hypothetical protein
MYARGMLCLGTRRMSAYMSLGSGGPSVVRIFPDHGAACLVDSDVRRTRNGSTGGGASLAAGQRSGWAPLRSQRQLDKVGIPWLPSFEPFGSSSRSCCSTGRLIRSSSLRLPLFSPARHSSSGKAGRDGGGPGQTVVAPTTARTLPSTRAGRARQ